MDEERLLQTVQKDVRSLLVASKNGQSIQELEQDYKMMIGSHLPLRVLGYRSTIELLLDMPNVVNVQTKKDGTVILSAVVDESTKEIAALVAMQKNPTNRRVKRGRRTVGPRCHNDLMRRGRAAPVLPATVKSEIRDLLSMSPLLLSEFDRAFIVRFGRPFQYTRYGFYSMFEVLRSVADIVQVKQTRAGSLLMLRKSEATGISFGHFINRNTAYKPFQHKMPQKVQPLTPPQVTEEKPSVQDISLPIVALPPITDTSLQKPHNSNESKSMFMHMFPKDSNVTEHFEANASMEEPLVSTENKVPRMASTLTTPLQAQPQNINIITTVRPAQLVDTHTNPGSPTNAVIKETAETTAEADDCLHWLEAKLEKELRLCLAKKGAGGCVNPDLRQDIKNIVNQHPQGLLVSQLPILFKCKTGKDLPFKQLGFMSVMELVGSLGDFLYMERTEDGQDWHLFDTETKRKVEENSNVLKSISNNSMFSWNSPLKSSPMVKPKSFKVSQVDGNTWWGPLELLLSSSTQTEIPPDAVIKQRLCCLPWMKRGFMIGVFVENIRSPTNFYVRCCGKDTSEKLEDMMIEMRHCYSSECVSDRYLVPDHCICVGELYTLKVPGDVWWYRVIIHVIHNSEEVDVFYPDFGNVATVKRSWLRFLKNCYVKLPAQAVPSSLSYVTPVDKQWSTKAIKRFQQLCSYGPLVALVLQYVQNVLYLFLCDTSSDDDDVYLHQLLINEDLASMGQEPATSKVLQKVDQFTRYLTPSPVLPQEESTEHQSPEHNKHGETELTYQKELVIQDKAEADLCMPYLEALPAGTDVWDETWTFLNPAVSSIDTSKQSNVNTEIWEEQKVAKEPSKIPVASDDADLLSLPLEEFYISLIKSRSQENSDIQSSPPTKEPPLLETVPLTQTGDCFSLVPEENNPCEEKSESYFCGEPSYYQQSSYPANHLLGLPKLQIPRLSSTMALGPAARLATAGSLLHWVPDQGKA
ncbi:tudor domain-containing protein 5 [Discoglossus pictus]